MSCAPDLEEIRQRLLKLAGTKQTRSTTFSRERPVQWSPSEVMHPEHGMYFTDSGAWEFIIELLSGGYVLTALELDKPPGAWGFVMVVATPQRRDIYIKLELCGNRVHGRSFHYSER